MALMYYDPSRPEESMAAIMRQSPGESWEPIIDPTSLKVLGWRDPTRGAGGTINFGGAWSGAPTESTFVTRVYDDQGNLSDAETTGGISGGRDTMQSTGTKVLKIAAPALLAAIGGQMIGGQLGLLGETAGAGGSGLGSAGAMAPSDALLMAGGEPIAGSGFSLASSGTPAFGQAFLPGATLSQAGEAAGSLFGLPNMVGVPGAVAGGALSVGSQLGELGNAVIPGVNAPPPAAGQPGGPPAPPTDTKPPGTTTGGPTTDVKKDVGLQLPTDLAGWLKLLGPAALAALGYVDANNKNGQTTGYQPSMDKFSSLMGQTLPTPTFSTGLMGTPTFSTSFQQPTFSTGLTGPQEIQNALLKRRMY